MDKHIVAKKLYDKLNELGGCGAEPDTYTAGWDDAITAAIDALDDMPAADVAPLREAVDIGFLQEWYQKSVIPTDSPVWTDEHLEELTGDFILIPREAVK